MKFLQNCILGIPLLVSENDKSGSSETLTWQSRSGWEKEHVLELVDILWIILANFKTKNFSCMCQTCLCEHWHDANVNTSSDKENDFMWVMLHTSKESLLDVHYKLVGSEKFVIVTLQDATEMMSCFASQHKWPEPCTNTEQWLGVTVKCCLAVYD